MAVDWEQRIDFDRFAAKRLARAKALWPSRRWIAALFRHEQRALPDGHAHWYWAQDKSQPLYDSSAER